MGGLDGGGPGPGRIGEIAVEEDCGEGRKDADEWEEVVHRSLLLLEPWARGDGDG